MSPMPVYAFDVFVDESYDEANVYTVAGFLAPREAWTRLWQAWDQTLASEQVVKFHAVDCETRSKAFKGWTAERAEILQAKLLALITDPVFGLVAYSASVELAAHARLLPRLKQLFKFPPGLSVNGPLYHPYFMLMQRVVELTLTDDLLDGYPTKDLVAFTFDRQDKAPNAKAVAEAIWRFRPWGERVHGAGWMDSAKVIPLQIADLLAYETFRHHRDVTLGGGVERWQYEEIARVTRVNEFHDAVWLESIVAHNEDERTKERKVAEARRAVEKSRKRSV